jgi:DeoR/GlpR family transcriptional regulator of sugar metabolism
VRWAEVSLEAGVKRAMLEHSEQPVLLLDDSKLTARGRQAIASVDAVSLVLWMGWPPRRRSG